MSIEKSHDVKLVIECDLVIEESVRQLKTCESRAVQLPVCMEYFNKRKASGDPFPGIEILRKKGLILESEEPVAKTATAN